MSQETRNRLASDSRPKAIQALLKEVENAIGDNE